MSKIYIQGTFGAYSHLAALQIELNAEIIPCKTFDECFLKVSSEHGSRMVIPESNRITGNIGIEYLIFKYRLNIYAEYFQKIEHNLLGQPGASIDDIRDVFSHTQGLSQCSNFIKKNNFVEHIRADTAGSAEAVSKKKIKSEAAIASSLSAKIYNLKILAPNIENESENTTRFLIMGKNIEQPEYTPDKKFNGEDYMNVLNNKNMHCRKLIKIDSIEFKCQIVCYSYSIKVHHIFLLVNSRNHLGVQVLSSMRFHPNVEFSPPKQPHSENFEHKKGGSISHGHALISSLIDELTVGLCLILQYNQGELLDVPLQT